ncbi:putative reverse transcriptase domain-containing protein [Tanacetum coccineum]
MLEDPYVEAALQAPPSPDYVPGPEEPEQAPPSPDYVPGPEHDDDEIVAEDQPYAEYASPIAQSPDYVPESDPEADPEEDGDEDPEEDPIDYPADGGDDGDDEMDIEEDEDDDMDIEADEEDEDDEMDVEIDEEEHLAPAYPVVVALPATAPSAEETEPFETDESAATPPPHPAYVARLLAISSPPASPLSPWSSSPTPDPFHLSPPSPIMTAPPPYYFPLLPLPTTFILSPHQTRLTHTNGPLSAPIHSHHYIERTRPRLKPTNSDEVRFWDGDCWRLYRELQLVRSELGCTHEESCVMFRRDTRWIYTRLDDEQGTEAAIGTGGSICCLEIDVIMTYSLSSWRRGWDMAGDRRVTNQRTDRSRLRAMSDLWRQTQTLTRGDDSTPGLVTHTAGTTTPEAAHAMPWAALKKMMTDKYCPRGEIKKIETEMWNLKIKSKARCGGLYVKASKSKTMQEVIEFTTELMEDKTHAYAERQAERKRKNDDLSKNNQNQQNKRQNTSQAYTAGNSGRKSYAGSKPLCSKCNYNHGNGCFECGAQGHFKSNCPRLRNNDRGNQAGNDRAPAKVYVVGNAGANPDNVVAGTFLLNNRYAYILFDTGADRSFVSTTFSSQIDITPSALDHYYDVELADGRIIGLNTILKGCTLNFLNHQFNINLMPVELGSFDAIIGMDWLAICTSGYACGERRLFASPGKIKP